MEPIEIFMFLWMWILPMVGVVFLILFPVFWFLLMPKISKKLFWAKFKNANVIAMADDSGWAELIVTTKTLPEGIHETKEHGWRFQLRPRYSKEPKDVNVELAEQLASRKYMLKDLGKPFWFCYSGKVALFNPATLAALEQPQYMDNPKVYFKDIRDFAGKLSADIAEPLRKLVDKLEEKVESAMKPVTVLDPKIVKTVLPQMITPSQIDALAANRELYGMKKRGMEYGKLILGGSLIIGLIILAIVAMSFAFK